MDRRENSTSLWALVEKASKEVESWDEWKKQYAANPNLREHSQTHKTAEKTEPPERSSE